MIHLRVVSPPDITGSMMPMLRDEPGVINLTMLPDAVSHPDGDAIPAAADVGTSLAFGVDREAWGSLPQLLLNVAVLTLVAWVGIPIQRAIWLRSARRAAAAHPPNLQQTGG